MFMTDFITENWKFLAIVGGVILFMTLLYLAYAWHCKNKLKKYNRQHANDVDKINIEKQISLQDLIDQEIISTYESKNNKQNGTQNDVVSQKADSAQEQPVNRDTPIDLPLEGSSINQESAIPEAESVSAQPEKKPAEESLIRPKQVVKEENIDEPVANSQSKPKKVQSENTKPTPKPATKKPLGRYHVLYRKDDKQWLVKREGSDRILRVLPTQKEAIAFATIKAITQDTSFVIHKQDGKIKKQN